MTFKTWDEWKRDGYHVVKGSRATWIEDKAMFSNEQVAKNKPRTYAYPDKTYGYDWDLMEDHRGSTWDLDYY